MDFRLTDEQLEFQRTAAGSPREVIRPIADKHDREQSVPWEAIKAAREWELHGLEHIQRMGNDPDGLLGVIYAEELHWGCAGIALAISASSLAAAGIAASGTPEQIGQWVPECFGEGDEIKLGAYAVTEAGAGSDVKSLRTTAKLDGDEWVLNGTKVFISNGGIADVNVVVATVDPELGHRGQASFIVPKDTPGLSLGKKEDKIGIRASQTAEVVLEDCRIPMDYLLGGMEKLEKKLERARSGQNGRLLRRARHVRDHPPAGRRLRARHRAGRLRVDARVPRGQVEEDGVPLLEQQRVQQMLADVATEIEAARLLVWRAAWMGRNGVPMTGGQGSMSKLKAGDVTMWATTTLMDLVGPYAQTTDCPLEKWFRDAKIYQLFEGTAQVQRLVISRMQRTEYRQRSRRPRTVLGAGAGRPPGDDGRQAQQAPSRPRQARLRTTERRVTMGVGFSLDPAVITAAARRHRPVRARGARAGPARLRRAGLAAGRLARGHRADRDRAAVADRRARRGPAARAHGPAPADRRPGRAAAADRPALAGLRVLPAAAACSCRWPAAAGCGASSAAAQPARGDPGLGR